MTINHGTDVGYQQHRLIGEHPCRDCKDAHAAYGRKYRRTNPAQRRDGRIRYARAKTLAAFKDLAPDLYVQLYREAIAEWDRDNPIEGSAP